MTYRNLNKKCLQESFKRKFGIGQSKLPFSKNVFITERYF